VKEQRFRKLRHKRPTIVLKFRDKPACIEGALHAHVIRLASAIPLLSNPNPSDVLLVVLEQFRKDLKEPASNCGQ
jgi:hypothetical protein